MAHSSSIPGEQPPAGTSFGERVWLNGRIVPFAQASVDMGAHALHYGGSVFEGLRSYGGKIFAARLHAERLIRSAELIGMTIGYTPDELIKAMQETLDANGLSRSMTAYLRPVAFRGNSGGLGLWPSSSDHATVAMMAWDWSNPLGSSSLSTELSHWRRFDPRSFPTESKSAAMYVVSSLAKKWAQEQGSDDALLMDHDGYVAELSGANVMFVADGEIHTPTPTSFLNGITRQVVMRLARQEGIAVAERQISPDELASFSEAFVVGTMAEVTFIGRIGAHHYNAGSVSRNLQESYRHCVETGDDHL